jgi:hypothetical protein
MRLYRSSVAYMSQYSLGLYESNRPAFINVDAFRGQCDLSGIFPSILASTAQYTSPLMDWSKIWH